MLIHAARTSFASVPAAGYGPERLHRQREGPLASEPTLEAMEEIYKVRKSSIHTLESSG